MKNLLNCYSLIFCNYFFLNYFLLTFLGDNFFLISLILDFVFILSVKNGFTVFQEVLLSVMSLLLILLKKFFFTRRLCCLLYAFLSMSLVASRRTGHFEISKIVKFFINWDNFLKKVDTVSVLYTGRVANKRSIFSRLMLIFVKHCGCYEQVYCFFSTEPHKRHFLLPKIN